MAQRKPEDRVTLQQVLQLVEQLSNEDREELLESLKIEDLRREIRKGISSADRGDLVSEEDLLKRLDARRRQLIERQNK